MHYGSSQAGLDRAKKLAVETGEDAAGIPSHNSIINQPLIRNGPIKTLYKSIRNYPHEVVPIESPLVVC